MNDFKGRHFEGQIILWAVRWYCKYGVSYRELEEMLEERGVVVDHTTIYRWTQRYAPEIEKRLRWYWRRPRSTSWRVDETYVKVRGRWAHLYRAVDKAGTPSHSISRRPERQGGQALPQQGAAWAEKLGAPQADQHRQSRVLRPRHRGPEGGTLARRHPAPPSSVPQQHR